MLFSGSFLDPSQKYSITQAGLLKFRHWNVNFTNLGSQEREILMSETQDTWIYTIDLLHVEITKFENYLFQTTLIQIADFHS